jgi:hypothetical protein
MLRLLIILKMHVPPRGGSYEWSTSRTPCRFDEGHPMVAEVQPVKIL